MPSALFLSIILVISNSQDDELAKLQGTWIAEHIEEHGKKTEAEPIRFKIEGDAVKVYENAKLLMRRKIGLSIKNMRNMVDLIDLNRPEKKMMAIYKLEEDYLVFCVAGDFGDTSDNRERPVGFQTTGTGHFVLYLKKKDKKSSKK